MAISSIGYDGTVDESDWTKLMGEAARAVYGVAGRDHWKVTTHATLARGVSIATGSGWGHGVFDTSDATVSLAGATISSGTRWDMVVARRNWSGTGGATSFAMITGTSTKALPARNTSPGSLDDQPIALVQFTAGQTAPTAIVDLRVWSGNGGGMTAQDFLAREYNDGVGTRIFVGGEDWVSTIGASGGQTWTRVGALNSIQLFGFSAALSTPGAQPPTGVQFLVQSGTWSQITDGAGYARITFPVPFPNGLLYVSGMNGDDYAAPAAFISSSGLPQHGTSGYGDKSSWVYALVAQDPATKTFAKLAGKGHRINWLAIGW